MINTDIKLVSFIGKDIENVELRLNKYNLENDDSLFMFVLRTKVETQEQDPIDPDNVVTTVNYYPVVSGMWKPTVEQLNNWGEDNTILLDFLLADLGLEKAS